MVNVWSVRKEKSTVVNVWSVKEEDVYGGQSVASEVRRSIRWSVGGQ